MRQQLCRNHSSKWLLYSYRLLRWTSSYTYRTARTGAVNVSNRVMATHWIVAGLVCALMTGCAAEDARAPEFARAEKNSGEMTDSTAPVDTVEADIAGSNDPTDSSSYNSASTSTTQAVAHTRNPSFLPEERAFLVDGAVSVDAVERKITTREFSKFVESLSLESASDTLAQDMTTNIKKDLDNRWERIGRIEAFACGLSLCAGYADIGRNLDAYHQVTTNPDLRSPHIYNYLDYLAERPDGTYQARFVMSVDPSIISVKGKSFP